MTGWRRPGAAVAALSGALLAGFLLSVRAGPEQPFSQFALLDRASEPTFIVAGPDGALWFTELNANTVGRITTDGALTEYPVAGGPVGITVGKDDQLYVDLFTAKAVDRVSLDGEVTGHWDLPGAGGPLQITTGFGLDVWVTDSSGGKLYRVTPYALGR